MEETEYDLVGNIIAYETGYLHGDSVINLFANLVKTGKAWTLQGSYGRTARNLIDEGYLSEEGEVLSYGEYY